MIDKMYCSLCGQKRKDNATFCTACGARVLVSSGNKGRFILLAGAGVIVAALLCFILVFQWIKHRDSAELGVESNYDSDRHEEQPHKCLIAYCSQTGAALQAPGPRGRDLAPGVTETITTVLRWCPRSNSIHIEENGQAYEGADVVSTDAGARFNLNGRTWEFNKHSGTLEGFTSENAIKGGLYMRGDVRTIPCQHYEEQEDSEK
jgi:hypothetical protein